jgi:hypothetical protein
MEDPDEAAGKELGDGTNKERKGACDGVCTESY